MIPRVIHYIWFGGKEEPAALINFKNSWEKNMPDWQIKRWDETNFDVNSSQFSRQAYEKKKWAFVSDYARIKILYQEGGIYLDTDEDVVKPLDPFLVHKVFFGMEQSGFLQAGVFGCEAFNPVVRKILEYYDDLLFVDNYGNLNETPIGIHIGNVLKREINSFEYVDRIQDLGDGIFVYSSKYFYPDLMGLVIDEEVYTIHRPNGSWLSPYKRAKQRAFCFISQNKLLSKLYMILKR